MCFTCRITALFIKSSAPIGQSRAGRNPAHCATANRLPEKFWCMCEGNGGGVGYLHRVGLCEMCVWVFGQAQWIAVPGSASKLLRIPANAHNNRFLKAASDCGWPMTGTRWGHRPLSPAPLEEAPETNRRGIKKGVVYVNLAIPPNATAQSPLLFSGFIDTRV